MIVDIVTFNNERELFEIRYNVLKDYVDEFRVIEFDKTFSGREKHAVFAQNWPKVKSYYVTEATWSKYKDLALSSPNTEYGKGASHWITEFCQKESIKDCLTDLQDDDQVFIGDVDEIWNPDLVYVDLPKKLKLHVYSYWLNNKSSEQFWGTLVAYYDQIKNECLNHLRANAPKTELEFGQHFTSMGGYENVKKKLTDSYTEDSYANNYVLDNLYENINGIHDFLGRDYSYTKDESEWPQYLKDTKLKYRRLLRP